MNVRATSLAARLSAAVTAVALGTAAVLYLTVGSAPALAVLASFVIAAGWIGYRSDDATAALGTAIGVMLPIGIAWLLVAIAATSLPTPRTLVPAPFLPTVLVIGYVVAVFHVFGTVIRSLERFLEERTT